MGWSVSVVPIADDQIRELENEPGAVDHLLRGFRSFDDACYLADFWHGVHFLLAQQVEPAAPPSGAVRTGDVHFVGAEDPAHAIYSATTKALADEMQALDEAALRARYDPPRMLKVYPGRYWLNNEKIGNAAERSFPEVCEYFRALRDMAAQASGEGKGLLFCRYEDW